MAVNINRVTLTGNLTRDPELRTTGSGTSVCSMRIAVNTRRKDGAGDWVDKPNFFDVTVWGKQGENCATYLEKGRPVAVDGRLEWREWEDRDGNKRQSVDVIAESVQFLGEGGGNRNGGGGRAEQSSGERPGGGDQDRPGGSGGDRPGGQSDEPPPPSSGSGPDDDIPF